jgi:putative RNA 2'-phosphotransferase
MSLTLNHITSLLNAPWKALGRMTQGAAPGAELVEQVRHSGNECAFEDDLLVEGRLLSRTVCHALRHAPEQYGLELSPEGWADIDELLAGLRNARPEWRRLSKRKLLQMVIWSRTDRHELHANRIRALYGHGFSVPIERQAQAPPTTLLHGTVRPALEQILAEGLKPMTRQHVHLTTDKEYALSAPGRKAGRRVLLEVQASLAHQAGIRFYQATGSVWLADPIPPLFITVLEQPAPGAETVRRAQRFLSATRLCGEQHSEVR